MCRHIYDWNIVNCDVKQPIQLNSTQLIANIILFHIFTNLKIFLKLSNMILKLKSFNQVGTFCVAFEA